MRRRVEVQEEEIGVKRSELFLGTKSEKRAKYKEYKTAQDPLFPFQAAVVAVWEKLRSKKITKEERNGYIQDIDKICAGWKVEGVEEPMWKLMRRPISSRVICDCVKMGFLEPQGKPKAETLSCILIPFILKTLLIHTFEAANDRYAHHILEELIYRVNTHAAPRYFDIPVESGMGDAVLAEYVTKYSPEPLYGPAMKSAETDEEEGGKEQPSKRALQRLKREEKEKEKAKPCEYILLQVAASLAPHFNTLLGKNFSTETAEALYAKAGLIQMLCRKDLAGDQKEVVAEPAREGYKAFSFDFKQKLLLQSIIRRPLFKEYYAPKEEVDVGKFPDVESREAKGERKEWKLTQYPEGTMDKILSESFGRDIPMRFNSNKLRNLYSTYVTYCRFNPKTIKNKIRVKIAKTTDEMLKQGASSGSKSFNTFELLLSGLEAKFTQATDFDDADVMADVPAQQGVGGKEEMDGDREGDEGESENENENEEMNEEEGEEEEEGQEMKYGENAGAPEVTGMSSRLKRHQRKAIKQLVSPLFQDVLATGAALVITSMTHTEMEKVETVEEKGERANNTVFMTVSEEEVAAIERNKRRTEVAVKAAESYRVLADPFIQNKELIPSLLENQGGVVFLYNMMNIDQDTLSDVLDTKINTNNKEEGAQEASLKAGVASSIIKLREKVRRQITAPLGDAEEVAGMGECILYQVMSKFLPLSSKILHGPPVRQFPDPAILLPLLVHTSDPTQLGRMGFKQGAKPMWLLYALNSVGNVILLEMLGKDTGVWVDWLCGKVVKVLRACCEISGTFERSDKAVARLETSRVALAEMINNIEDADVFGLGAEMNDEGRTHPLYKLVKDLARLIVKQQGKEKEKESEKGSGKSKTNAKTKVKGKGKAKGKGKKRSKEAEAEGEKPKPKTKKSRGSK